MKKLQIVRGHLSASGFRWTLYFILHGFLKCITKVLTNHMRALEMKRKLPGDHTISRNYAGWQDWDWSKRGEEWTPSPEWKQSLIDEVLLRYIEPGRDILEIGPGAGRWTETLQKIAKRLIIVDLSDRCIEICKKRFAMYDNIEYYVNNGTDVSFIHSDSIDFIWSFDVFVHINAWDTEKYLIEFSRILKKGGRCIIHHPKEGRHYELEDDGWRSNMTAELFCGVLEKHGLILMRQFDSWGERGEFDVKCYHDIITVFER